MKVKGKINGHWVTILIDTSSTHNFLDATMLSILQLSLDSTLTFEVKLANGATIQTQGVCANVSYDARACFCSRFECFALRRL